MHKFAILLIGILSVLLLSEKENTHSAPIFAAEIRIDRAAEDQWLCERRNNSDLMLTRIVCEVATSGSTLLNHSNRSEWGRAWHRPIVGLVSEHTERIKKSYNYSILSSVVRVADRYIYRLRRLII